MSEQTGESQNKFPFCHNCFNIKKYFTLTIDKHGSAQSFRIYRLEFAACNYQFIKRVGQSFYISGRFQFYP
jgi:hypothetical protein